MKNTHYQNIHEISFTNRTPDTSLNETHAGMLQKINNDYNIHKISSSKSTPENTLNGPNNDNQSNYSHK